MMKKLILTLATGAAALTLAACNDTGADSTEDNVGNDTVNTSVDTKDEKNTDKVDSKDTNKENNKDTLKVDDKESNTSLEDKDDKDDKKM